jgi:hypothetical protein
VNHEGEFSREHPPFAVKGQVAAFHVGKIDLLSSTDLGHMLGKASA